ncbi:unnamed protein product [Protopolystoma xenopodis]|uniref:Uncharacterized protein n=1 Tax=Protopolystoma xenopodis TaxID=117903 RepID=A0A3S5CNP8_9PLAT|nr:unnamed protein product [Protopolystoma xenopodis]
MNIVPGVISSSAPGGSSLPLSVSTSSISTGSSSCSSSSNYQAAVAAAAAALQSVAGANQSSLAVAASSSCSHLGSVSGLHSPMASGCLVSSSGLAGRAAAAGLVGQIGSQTASTAVVAAASSAHHQPGIMTQLSSGPPHHPIHVPVQLPTGLMSVGQPSHLQANPGAIVSVGQLPISLNHSQTQYTHSHQATQHAHSGSHHHVHSHNTHVLNHSSTLPQGSGVLRQQTKEPAYHPQVEAISPAPEESRQTDAQDLRLMREREEIRGQLNSIDDALNKQQVLLRNLIERQNLLEQRLQNAPTTPCGIGSGSGRQSLTSPPASQLTAASGRRDSLDSLTEHRRSYENPIHAIIAESRQRARQRQLIFARFCGAVRSEASESGLMDAGLSGGLQRGSRSTASAARSIGSTGSASLSNGPLHATGSGFSWSRISLSMDEPPVYGPASSQPPAIDHRFHGYYVNPGPYALPLYRQPSDLPSLSLARLEEVRERFRPRLVAYLRRRRQAEEARLTYLAEQPNGLLKLDLFHIM